MSRDKQNEYYELERLLQVRKIDIEKQGCDLYSLLHKTETEEQSLARYLIDCGYCKASEVAEEISEEICRIADVCGGGVLFYQRMIKLAEELKKEYTERGKEQNGQTGEKKGAGTER